LRSAWFKRSFQTLNEIGPRNPEPVPTLRRHLTPSLVISFLALFISLSGGAYALTVSGKNIKNGSITTADVKNKSLTASDFRPGTLPAFRFSLTPKSIVVGHSVSVGAQKGFSFTLVCSREQADGWDGNGLEIVAKLRGSGGVSTKDLASTPAYPRNEANIGQNIGSARATGTTEFKLVGEEADAQGEATLVADANSDTCSLDSGIVKVR
jgi:hypothetical protein